MSSGLDRDELEQSPLADLHLLANELGVDGFRRLRKAELIDAIIARQTGAEPPSPDEDDEGEAPAPRTRRRARADAEAEAETETDEEGATDEDAPARGRRGRRGGRGRGRREDGLREPLAEAEDDRDGEDRVAEGEVELLGNGSAFIR